MPSGAVVAVAIWPCRSGGAARTGLGSDCQGSGDKVPESSVVCGHTGEEIWAAAKGAGTVLSCTDFEELRAHVGQDPA